MKKELLHLIEENRANHQKMLAVLIDPDKINHVDFFTRSLKNVSIDFFFVGGSLLNGSSLFDCIDKLKSTAPVVIFPGDNFHISDNADAILLLSLISGRNAEMLIGKHVAAAPYLKKSGLEIVPTGYMVINTGAMTSVSYMSQTFPLPYDKNDIAVATALAGEMLGLKLIYLDGGSGAQKTVSCSMVKAIRENSSLPIIVGGGIKTAEQAADLCNAGADVIVVGNVLEKNPELLPEISRVVHQ
ncbi:MAG: geranylgeranylglyceryl/heptaprenylglyceryl phosphate synthase [Bacteroidales bacterium]|nr:geranylgeranylglyceryl/heptaprenylglyceryl phosphate synthase [Bacteroidales bacterium]